jgi:hypothetical protein
MRLSELLGLLAGVRRGPGKRYPDAVRARVVSWVESERARGRCLSVVAAELGMPVTTLMRWCASRRALPVVVETVAPVTSSAVSVVTPSGWRIEGLSLEQAASLLGAR